MTDEYISLFRRNFPFIVREEATVRAILENKDCRVTERRNKQGVLIGVAVIHNNTILMLCVDKEYRNRGIGSELLSEAEQMIKDDGYEEITAGAGYDYLMPGVPTSKRYVDAVNQRLYEGVDDSASTFFEKRGYTHSWDCNCFDMRFPLAEFTKEEYGVGDMVTVGTKYLKDAGMKEAYLGYTYSGLDRMYGYAGYKICIYYMMAKKSYVTHNNRRRILIERS